MGSEPYRVAAPPPSPQLGDEHVRCARCGIESTRDVMFAWGTRGDICETCFRSWRAEVALRASTLRMRSSETWTRILVALAILSLFATMVITLGHRSAAVLARIAAGGLVAYAALGVVKRFVR